MGDTINVLSNNWWRQPPTGGLARTAGNDCQSRQPLADRVAGRRDRRVNAAFIGGVDDDHGRQLQRRPRELPALPRGLERRVTLTYRGSFVSLGDAAAQQRRVVRHRRRRATSTTRRCATGTSTPTSRTSPNLPPLTPRFVSVQQILFTENFR